MSPQTAVPYDVLLRWTRRPWTGVAIAAVVGASLLGATGDAVAQDDLTGYTGTLNLQGRIDGSDSADIRVYSNGAVVHQATTDVTGGFDIRFEVSGAKDETLIVWFLPDNENVVPELLLLKESSNARRSAVWSPCVPREKATDVVLYNVTFRDEKAILASLQESDCFEQG